MPVQYGALTFCFCSLVTIGRIDRLDTSPIHDAASPSVERVELSAGPGSCHEIKGPGQHCKFTDPAWFWIKRMLYYVKYNRDDKILSLSERLEGINRVDLSGSKPKKQKRLDRRKENILKKINSNDSLLIFLVEEILEMECSPQVYDIEYIDDKGKTDACTLYDVRNGRIIFFIPDSTVSQVVRVALFAHEFKHGYQFETGQTSIQLYNNGKVTPPVWFLHDMKDEEECFERQGRIDSVPADWREVYRAKVVGQNKRMSETQIDISSIPSHEPSGLQQLAIDNRYAFRVNDVTYAPPLDSLK